MKLRQISFLCVCSLSLLLLQAMPVMGVPDPDTSWCKFDADYGSTIYSDGDLGEYGIRTDWVSMGSGQKWVHDSGIPAYMGLSSYKSLCYASPGSTNDRTEQKILASWAMSDGVRYFRFAVYVPSYTDTDSWLFFCQWWQDETRTPPLTIGWDYTDDHIYLARRYDGNSHEDLWDGGELVKNRWYHFVAKVKFGFNNTGCLGLWLMNNATGEWEQKFYDDSITLGWYYKSDGVTRADTENFNWKVGTYRGASDLTTRIFYDNIVYAKYWGYVTDDTLVGYHKDVMDLWFEENSGTSTNDHSDYDNDGTLVNGAGWNSSGVGGSKCVSLDGANDYVRVPIDTTDFDFGNYATSAGWIKTSTAQYSEAVLTVDEYSSTYKMRLYMVTPTQISFTVRHHDDTLQTVTANLANSIHDGNWHQLVGTYNRWASDGNRLKIYLDGNCVGTASGADKAIYRGDNYVYIGRYSGEYFEGYVDEVQLYNYALTDAEVSSLYNSY